LEAVAAVEDRQKIAPRGLLDEDRGNVSAIAAPPKPRDRDVAPFYRRAVTWPHFILEARGQDRRLAAPVAQVLGPDPGQERMIGHSPEDPAQAVLGRAEPEPLLQNIRGLLEHEHLQAIAHTRDVRHRTLDCHSGLANDENVVWRKVGVKIHESVPDSQSAQ
jgi:hypothetical protein